MGWGHWAIAGVNGLNVVGAGKSEFNLQNQKVLEFKFFKDKPKMIL